MFVMWMLRLVFVVVNRTVVRMDFVMLLLPSSSISSSSLYVVVCLCEWIVDCG